MADISGVNFAVIKDLYQQLEGLSCRRFPPVKIANRSTLLTVFSSNYDESVVLNPRSPLALEIISPERQRRYDHSSIVA